MAYIKLRNQAEYCVSDDSKSLLYRHNPSSQDFWSTACLIPTGKQVLKFRESKTGANVEVLLNDNRWYKIDSNGQSLRLTTEELEKDRNARNAQKESKNVKDDAISANPAKGEKKNSLRESFQNAKNAYDTFRNVDDSSKFEADANRICNDFITQQQNIMDESYRAAEAMDRLIQENARKRDVELNKLRKIEANILAKENKERIFANLEKLLEGGVADFSEGATYIAKYTGVSTQDGLDTISRAIDGYQRSSQELERSSKFYKNWSEIFFLISEGLLFPTHHIDFIVKLINKDCGGSNHSDLDPDDNFDDYLKMCYSKFKRPLHWGYNFEKLPYEDNVKARIHFLSFSLCLDEPYVYDHSLDSMLSKETINDVSHSSESEKVNVKNSKNTPRGDEDTSPTNKTRGKNKPKQQSKNLTNIFSELNEKFKAEKIEDESIKPKGLFDFATRNRNRKVENLKYKRRDLQEEIEGGKKDIRKKLISILKSIEKLLEKEKMLEDTKNTPIKTNREKERLEEKVERLEDQIESIQDDIESCNDDVKDYFNEVLSNVNKYNKVNQELFELTSSDRYKEKYELQGPAIDIAKNISQNTKLKDSKGLTMLFGEYLN